MAEQQVQAAPVPINVNIMYEPEVVLFHADPTQDSFPAEFWIEQLQRMQATFGWTNERTIFNAIDSLRGKAVHFPTFLEKTFQGQNATTSNWPLFKQQFLLAFGRRPRDTPSVANLDIVQESNETVQTFAHRVVVTTNEFFADLGVPQEFDFQTPEILNTPELAALAANPDVQRLIQFAISRTVASIKSSFNKTIYLNGLNAAIRAQVKDTLPTTFMEAYNNAIRVQSNQQEPIDHTIALQKGSARSAAQSVNTIQRGGARGRGGSNGSSRLNYSTSNSASQKKMVKCWYCRKPGHVQYNCRKRIARGAAAAAKPRSAAEISWDNMMFQDGSEDETDDFLNVALNI
jgi:hypothetical protein